LQDGRELGLVGLILEELQLDLDAGVRRLIAARDFVPDFDLRGIGFDVEPFHCGVGRSRAQPDRPRGTGESKRT